MKKIVVFIIVTSSFFSFAQENEKKMKPSETEIWEPKVPVVVPGKNNTAPSDAIILFDGTNLDQWVNTKDETPANWHLNADGSMMVKDKAGDIKTKQKFGNVQLHIEWKSPIEVQGKSQSRANSGVLLQSRYEIQVLDNNNNDTYVNGQVASVYKQSIPLVNASASTGDWNTYDIIFHQPEFDENGGVIKKATITVIHNGVLVQDYFTIEGTTSFIGYPKYEKHGKASLKLQDHKDNSRVSYRNIWVRELD